MDLPVSSFVSHSSLLTVESVPRWFPFVTKIMCDYIVATLITEVLFKELLIRTVVVDATL